MIVYSKTSNICIPYAVCLGKTISKNSLRKLGNYNSMARYIPQKNGKQEVKWSLVCQWMEVTAVMGWFMPTPKSYTEDLMPAPAETQLVKTVRRPLGRALIRCDWCPIRRGCQEIDMHNKDPERNREKRQPPEETNLVSTLASGFPSPALWESKCPV